MTGPRRALATPRPRPVERFLHWCRDSWQAAALAAAVCLVVAGIWPVLSPPAAPLPEAPPDASITAVVTAAATAPVVSGQSRANVADSPTSPSAPVPGFSSPTPVHTAGPRLLIGALGISAPLHEVGVSAGELEIPADPAAVGIWRDGARPGDPTGTVLVSGHVSWDGRRGGLWPLASAGLGDLVELVTPDGTVTHWIVTTADRVLGDQDHPDLFTRSGPHRLVVVTCGGPVVDGRYRDLVVVVAEPA